MTGLNLDLRGDAGLSAATFGNLLEGAGPRNAMFASASCFALGFFISYFGVLWHQLWLI
jgi:hypothetical protein